MRGVVFASTALVAVMLVGQAAAAGSETVLYAPPPAWTKPILEGAQPTLEGQPATVLLSEEDQTRFTRDGVERFHAHRLKVLAAEGLSDAGQIAQEWDPATETLTMHSVAILRDGKRIDVLANDRFQVLRRERDLEMATLDGRLTASLLIPDVRVGDVVEYAYSTVYAPKLLAGRHASENVLLRRQPAGEQRIRAVWDKDAAFHWRAEAGAPKPTVSETPQGGELLVEVKDTRGARPPQYAPARFGLTGALQYSQFSDWKQVSALFHPLFDQAARLAPDSPVKAEAARIRAAAATPEARAALALKLVEEQVRYVAIQMDAQGYTPASADETWRRRFGDCKGKTALLLALLRELGIEAQAALVLSEDGDMVAGYLPQASAFDHVLVKATIGGRAYWLDGTRLGDSSLALLQAPDFRWALPLTQAGAGLEAIEQAPLERPHFQSTLRIDASEDLAKPAKVNLEVLLRGDEAIALARSLPRQAPARAKDYLIEEYGEEFGWAEFDEAQWRWDAASGLLNVRLSGTGQLRSARWKGEYYLPLDNSAWMPPPVRKRPAEQDQTAPYDLRFPGFARTITMLKLPEGGRGFALMGEDYEYTVGGIAQSRHTTLENGQVVMRRNIRSVKPELTPQEVEVATKETERSADFFTMVGVRAAVPPSRERPKALSALNSEQAYARGLALEDAEDWKGALAAYEAAAKKGARGPQLTLARARVLLQQARYPEAVAAIDAEPAVLNAFGYRAGRVRASALVQLGRQREVIDWAQAETAKTPRAWTHLIRAQALIEAKQDAEAEAALDAAFKLASADGDTEVLRGVIESAGWLQRPEKLAALHREMVRLLPHDADMWATLALTQERAGREAEAVETYEEALRADPVSRYAWSGRTDLLAKMGRRDEAKAALEEFAALLPDDRDALNSICWIQATRNLDAAKGLAACERGLSLHPGDSVLLDSRGFAKLRLDRTREALADYEAAVKKDPEQADSLYGRGVARARLGDAAGGQADLAAAEKLDPGIGERWKEYGLTP